MLAFGLLGLASAGEDASRWWSFLIAILNFIREHDWLSWVLMGGAVVGWLGIDWWTGRKLQHQEREDAKQRAEEKRLEAERDQAILQRRKEARTDLEKYAGDVIGNYDVLEADERAPSETWRRFKLALDLFGKAAHVLHDERYLNIHNRLRDDYFLQQPKAFLSDPIEMLKYTLERDQRGQAP